MPLADEHVYAARQPEGDGPLVQRVDPAEHPVATRQPVSSSAGSMFPLPAPMITRS